MQDGSQRQGCGGSSRHTISPAGPWLWTFPFLWICSSNEQWTRLFPSLEKSSNRVRGDGILPNKPTLLSYRASSALFTLEATTSNKRVGGWHCLSLGVKTPFGSSTLFPAGWIVLKNIICMLCFMYYSTCVSFPLQSHLWDLPGFIISLVPEPQINRLLLSTQTEKP